MVKIRVYRVGDYLCEIDGEVEETVAAYNRILSNFDKGVIKILSADPSEPLKRYPSSKDIAKYIESKGEDMHYTIGELAEHFLGEKIVARSDSLKYHRFYYAVKRAQKRIEKLHNGRFKSKMIAKKKNGNGGANKPFKEFVFNKNS